MGNDPLWRPIHDPIGILVVLAALVALYLYAGV